MTAILICYADILSTTAVSSTGYKSATTTIVGRKTTDVVAGVSGVSGCVKGRGVIGYEEEDE